MLEAFAGGVPVIAPLLGPINEVVDDGRTGLLFRAGDPAHLAEKIAWALGHDEQLQSMGKSARAKFEENFSADKNYTRLMEIYERVISGSGYAMNPCGSLDQACYASQETASRVSATISQRV
jgi:glycosyltransferase involved in cell wall biosynthesis